MQLSLRDRPMDLKVNLVTWTIFVPWPISGDLHKYVSIYISFGLSFLINTLDNWWTPLPDYNIYFKIVKYISL